MSPGDDRRGGADLAAEGAAGASASAADAAAERADPELAALFDRARAARDQGDVTGARSLLEAAVARAEERGADADAPRMQLAALLVGLSEPDAGLRQLDACDPARVARDATALLARAGALRSLGRTVECLGAYRAAATAAQRAGDARRAVTATILVATVEDQLGRSAAAVAGLRDALAAATAAGEADLRVKAQMALAGALIRCDAPAEAALVARDALDGAREIGSAVHEAYALRALSATHELGGRSADAIRCAREAVDAARRSEEPLVLVQTRHRLGEALLHSGDATAARAEFEACAETSRGHGEQIALCIALGGLGEALLADGAAGEAALRAQEALALARTIEDARLELSARDLLTRTYEARGDTTAALAAQRELARVQRTVQEKESTERLERLRAELQVERAQTEAARAGERAVRRTALLFRLVLDRVPNVALHAYAPDGTVEAWNRESARLFGVPAAAAVGAACEDALPSAVAADVRRGLAGDDAARAAPQVTERTFLDRDGTERSSLASAFRVRDAAGRDLLVCSDVDVTDRVRSERSLAAALRDVQRLEQRLAAENQLLRAEIVESGGFEEIVGQSPALRRVLHQISQVAPTNASVLVLGETGVGKELIAHAIHARSPRKDRALVTVNCAALPASLIESELFGHEKGAFTGALARRLGRFELADGGTIFLDEIGELPLDLQAKLLRVLQSGEIERLGEPVTRRTDARVVAATNRDLAACVREGTFRADLYYRLAVFEIHMPPLRERRSDIPLLVAYFVSRYRTSLRKHIEHIPEATLRALSDYDWPGNVRELASVVQRAVILSNGDTLEIDGVFGLPAAAEPATEDTGETLESVERGHIRRVLDACGWRIKGAGNAAERLGLPPSTLRSRMTQLGITRPRGG